MSDLKKFKVVVAGKTTIQDLGIEGHQDDVFAVKEADAAVSSGLRKALKAGWIEEVDEDEDTVTQEEVEEDHGDDISDIERKRKDEKRREEKAAEALVKQHSVVRERSRTLKISSLKELKEFKKKHPGVIPEELSKDQQLVEMSRLQKNGKEDNIADLGLSEADLSEETKVVKPPKPKKKESTPETVQPDRVSVEEVVKSKGKKKVKKNVAPKQKLPASWDGMSWKERVSFLKKNGTNLRVQELEDIIDNNGPAVKSVAKAILTKKKQTA